MKKIMIISALLLALVGCSKEADTVGSLPMSEAGVYIAQATASQVSVNRLVVENKDYTYKLNVASGSPQTQNLTVAIKPNPALGADYSIKYNTTYEMLPESAYKLSATQLTIPSGKQLSDEISITLNPISLSFRKKYILPLSISATGTNVNTALDKVYYIIQPSLMEFDRTGWTILNFDSQEANGEGPNNGRAVFTLDGNTGTFWHTQWQGATPPLPHYVSVDMQSAKTLHGIWVINRQGADGGSATKVTVSTSLDGTTWAVAGNYSLSVTNDKQSVYFDNDITAKYFRVAVTETKGGTNYTFFSEIGAL